MNPAVSSQICSCSSDLAKLENQKWGEKPKVITLCNHCSWLWCFQCNQFLNRKGCIIKHNSWSTPPHFWEHPPKEIVVLSKSVILAFWSSGNNLIVDGHFGYYLFCLNLHEKGKYVQSSLMILKLPMLPESYQMLRERSRIVIYDSGHFSIDSYSRDTRFCVEIEDLLIQRSWLKILNTYFIFLDLFWFPFTLVTRESAIHFSDSQNSS